MKRKKRIVGALMAMAALIIMQLPMVEADAATSASDFKMEGSTLTKYRGEEKNVSVPDTVHVIAEGAFEENTKVELIVVPNSVTRIEAYAFWGCENLDTVVLGKGLTEVGDYTFTKCGGLKQISIPSTVTSIGMKAFADCTNLTDVTIPPETQEIHETAFDGCFNLTIHYEEGSAAEEYAKSFYERRKSMPGYTGASDNTNQPSNIVQQIVNPTPTPVPEEPPVAIESPMEVAGAELGATHIVGNKAVVMMNNMRLPVYGAEARRGAETQADQTDEGSSESGTAVPVTNKTAGLDFDGNGTVPKYRIVDGKIVADQSYYRSTGLGELALPDGIVEIGQLSFARSSLTSAALPQGVETIGYGAFYYCSRLENVTLPDSIRCVEPKAFDHTLWVENFLNGTAGDDGTDSQEGDFLVSSGVLVAYRGGTSDVVIPDGVRVIAAEVFQGHEEIENVSLPDSLSVIGEGAFENCDNLQQIKFGKNVEEIKDRAFLGNAMEEVSLPGSVKKVGLQAFGTAVIVYSGAEAEYTYEDSATRLYNEAYRSYEGTNAQEPGVTVEGLEGASASLEGASRGYTLSIIEPEDVSRMEDAFRRSFQSALPEDIVIYDLVLTDESEIPLKKLGNQTLSVTIPVPESLQGQELRLMALDRNGQPEPITAELLSVDGVDSLRFDMSYLSMVGIYGNPEN